MPDPKRIQCHFWIGADDYDFLRSVAKSQGEPVGAVLRRLVRRFRAAEALSQRDRSGPHADNSRLNDARSPYNHARKGQPDGGSK